MAGVKGEADVAGCHVQAGGTAGAASCARWIGLRSLQFGQWLRRYAAPRQTQLFGLQGRYVRGSRWRTQRGHAVASGTC